jgi:cytochrome P450
VRWLGRVTPGPYDPGKPTPPGSLGWPLVGETIAFARDPRAFFEDRFRRHGEVFKTHVFGHPLVCLSGPKALDFLADEHYFTRVDASPAPVRALLGEDALPFIDAPAHRKRKRLLLQALGEGALAPQVPVVEAIVRRYARKWERLGRFAWVPQLKSMGFAIGDSVFLGASPDGGNLAIERALTAFVDGELALPLPFPCTAYGRAGAARDTLLAHVRRVIAARRSTPGEDVVSRAVAARDEEGDGLTERELAMELVHFLFAAHSALWAALAHLGLVLAGNPAIAEHARAEVLRVVPSGPLSWATLERLDYVDRVVREVLRYKAIAPATFFARVRRGFTYGRFAVPTGWLAIGLVRGTMELASVFPHPEHFDPDRFAATPGDPAGYVPQGAGPPDGHRCGGETFTRLTMRLVAALLLREYVWTLPAQDFSDRTEGMVPVPRDDLIVDFRRRR